MCGMVGVHALGSAPVPSSLLRRMTDILRYRRLDVEDCYVNGPVGLGHQQRALIDVSISNAGRTKQGFSAPDASWSHRESIDYVNTLLRGRSTRIYDDIHREYSRPT